MSDTLEDLQSTREFWDSNPCGIHADYAEQRRQRYLMEPWLPEVLAGLAARHPSILEVGCGQGIDSTVLCALMAPGSRYTGIDYSPTSVDIARGNAQGLAAHLNVTPEYSVGNAESLAFADNQFDAVYSMGVIHHTADEASAIREVFRVLQPGGTATIFLYRRFTPKVAVAQGLRLIQAALDAILGSDRCIYRLLRRKGSHNRWFGTMFLECFGVPYLKSYSRKQIRNLFGDFSTLELKSVGANLGRLSPFSAKAGAGRFGYFWYITATK